METVQLAAVNGTHLAYQESGAGDAVVLIHGLGLDYRMWDDQIPALEKRFRVIRYDMRGFGQSDLPGSAPYTPAGDLKALLERLQVRRAAVIGLSLGGLVALQFVLAYPDMVSALVLIDAGPDGWTWSEEWSKEMRRIWALGREQGAEAACGAWLAHGLFAPAREQPHVAAALHTMVTEYSGFRFVHDDPQKQPDPPSLQRLEEIRCPTLVIVGERDLPDFQAMADVLTERIAGAEKIVIPGVGHMASMEAPQPVNEAVVEFLSQALHVEN
jgi:pimeloyl-ACP methyl ester carboxylesterase